MGRSSSAELVFAESAGSRCWLTASVAVTVLGMASVIPASTNTVAPGTSSAGAHLLASESDAVASLGDVLQTAGDNAENITDNFFDPFFPALQQETVHRLDLISQFPENPAGIFTFVGDVADEMGDGLDGHFSHFAPGDDSDLLGSINDAHLGYFDSYMDALGGDSGMGSLLDFLASPMSGILLGIFTPYIGAGLALIDDTTDYFEALASGDIGGAFESAVNEPVHFLDAFLNGYGEVDFDPIPVSDVIPGADSDDTISSMNLGGLLSTGGSLFNSVGIDGDDSGVSGEGFGEFGSLVSLQQGIATAVGWDGDGSPIDQLSDVDGFGWLGDLLNGL